MKKEIEEFKRQNGNVVYTVKELVQGLHVKIDKISDSKASKKMVTIMYSTLFSLLGALASYVFLVGG